MSPGEAMRLRKMIGAILIAAAVIVWAMAILMSPHSDGAGTATTTHVSSSVARFIRNSALGTLALTILGGALLFWDERPRRRWDDAIVVALLVALAGTSLYQMLWIETDVLDVEVQTAPIASDEI